MILDGLEACRYAARKSRDGPERPAPVSNQNSAFLSATWHCRQLVRSG